MAGYANERRAERALETIDMDTLFGTSGYDFVANKWTREVNDNKKGSVCSNIIGALTNSGYTPLEYANMLYQAGIENGDQIKKNQAVLIIRCFHRINKDKNVTREECSVADMIAALDAMGLSNDTDDMNETVDGILFGAASSGATMDTYKGGALHQVGGAPHDLATLLFLKRNLVDKLVEAGPEYASQLVDWIDGQLAQLKGCVIDILGINRDTFYKVITDSFGGLYNQGAIVVGDATSAISGWIKENKATAFGLTAFILRYQDNVMGAGRTAIGSVLPAIFNAFATAGATAGTVITQFWQSEPGVALLLSLYYYDQNADLINAAAVSTLTAGTDMTNKFMDALKQFEKFSSTKINDYAQVQINDDMVKMMAKLKVSLSSDDAATAAHRTELATILNKTAKTQAKLLETVNKTLRTRSQTARIAAAKANLMAVETQLTEATRALIAEELAAKGPRRGGKSHSRKLHKKVSKSNRIQKSVHSRKAKGAKRSNKKH